MAELTKSGVDITSPDKVLWPEMGTTKRDLAEYYQAVADVMVPRVRDRPLMLLRCPSGTEKQCFYQKHAKEGIPDVVPRVDLREKGKGEQTTYLYVNGVRSLMGLTQIGVLELHVWSARRDRLERPDRLVFDLDPDEDLPFGRVAGAASDLRDLLDDLGLRSFAKLTGGKGVHVVVPIERRTGWDDARSFARAVAERLAGSSPDDFTTDNDRAKRKGRIFIDYLRNARNATTIADYSPRAREGAPVAVPVAWDELSTRAKKPPRVGIGEVPDRIAEGDPWSGFDEVRQRITKGMVAEVRG